MKVWKLLVFLAGIPAFAQTTTITGTIKDLQNNVVTSGQISFRLNAPDTTIPGTARFVASTTYCNISSSGHPVGTDGVSACLVTSNTALSPSGTSYGVCIQPGFVTPGGCFNFYALAGQTVDISTIAPTPTTLPTNYSGVAGPAGPAGPQGLPGTVTATGVAGAFAVGGLLTAGDVGLPSTRTLLSKLQDIVSVKDFGAKGDGSTDDKTAFQNAINALTASASSLAVLTVPAGRYRISSPLTYTQISQAIGFHIKGEGRHAVQLIADSSMSGCMLNVQSAGASFTLSGMSVQAAVGGARSAEGVCVTDSNGIDIHDVWFNGFANGLDLLRVNDSKVYATLAELNFGYGFFLQQSESIDMDVETYQNGEAGIKCTEPSGFSGSHSYNLISGILKEDGLAGDGLQSALDIDEACRIKFSGNITGFSNGWPRIGVHVRGDSGSDVGQLILDNAAIDHVRDYGVMIDAGSVVWNGGSSLDLGMYDRTGLGESAVVYVGSSANRFVMNGVRVRNAAGLAVKSYGGSNTIVGNVFENVANGGTTGTGYTADSHNVIYLAPNMGEYTAMVSKNTFTTNTGTGRTAINLQNTALPQGLVVSSNIIRTYATPFFTNWTAVQLRTVSIDADGISRFSNTNISGQLSRQCLGTDTNGAVGLGVGCSVSATLTTTSATSDPLALSGVTSTSRCSSPNPNDSTTAAATQAYVSAKTANQVTVTHAATAGLHYDVTCSVN